MPNPIDHPDIFFSYALAGNKAPGQVTLSGLESAQKWDIKDGDGQDGASTTPKGTKPAQFTASHYLVHDGNGVDEFAEWDSFLVTLRAAQSGKQAMDFYHPDATELGVTSVVVEKIGAKVHDGMGGAAVVVTYLQYAPPKPKKVKSTGAGGGPLPPGPYASKPFIPPYDPNADAKATVAALHAEAKKPF